jgi:hypothetical protein
MTDAERQTFKLLDPAGNVIAHGDMAAVTEPILDSNSRRVAEALVRDARAAAGRIAQIDRRADSVAERETEVAAREDAIFADGVLQLSHKIEDIARRMDALERARDGATLDALPDPDDPENRPRLQQDDLLPPAMHEAPHAQDRQQLEMERGAQVVERHRLGRIEVADEVHDGKLPGFLGPLVNELSLPVDKHDGGVALQGQVAVTAGSKRKASASAWPSACTPAPPWPRPGYRPP